MGPPIQFGKRKRQAFTLLEVLLAVVLIGLTAGLFVAGSARLLPPRPEDEDTESRFWTAVLLARRTALESGRPVRLSWDGPAHAFVATALPAPSAPAAAAAATPEVRWLRPVAEGPRRFSFAAAEIPVEPADSALFLPDGTCTPFLVEFRGTEGRYRRVRIDPWTASRVESEGPR